MYEALPDIGFQVDPDPGQGWLSGTAFKHHCTVSPHLRVTQLWAILRFFHSHVYPSSLPPSTGALSGPYFAEHGIRGRNRYGLMHCWTRIEFFSVPEQSCSGLYPRAPDGWHRDTQGLREVCVGTLVVCAHCSHRLSQ